MVEEVEVFYGLHPGQSSTAFGGAVHRIPAATAEQIVDIPVPRGAHLDFHQDPPRAAGSSGLLGTANQAVFRTFHRGRKKVRRRSRPESQGARQCQLMDSSRRHSRMKTMSSCARRERTRAAGSCL